MSGIAGAIDLSGQRLLPEPDLHRMADVIAHRGPRSACYLRRDGVSLACRLSDGLGIPDTPEPATNEDGAVHVVAHAALVNNAEQRAALEAKGHSFRSRTDAELLAHLWEQHGEAMFDHLRGQYAFVLFDQRQRRVVLARDRFGVCPLHWSRQGDWLLFGSEIKALLASGMVSARPDRRGINHAFTFFALPGPVTCFEGVSILSPGRYLDVRLGDGSIREHAHWQVEFPEQGKEEKGGDRKQLVERFEQVMLAAVERRLPANGPVATYLSGGIDSGLVTAMACKLRGEPVPAFTIRIGDPKLDETADVAVVARHLGVDPTIVLCGADEVMATYPRLIQAVEGPVIDTACAALLMLAEKVRERGFQIALTGEGADEWLASYPWYRINKLLSYLDVIPGLPLSRHVRNAFLRITGAPRFPPDALPRIEALVGGPNGWLDVYGIISMAKLRFYSESMREVMRENSPYADVQLDAARVERYHPLNRALYLGARVHLPGLLLHAKGDRISMLSAVQQRYPFLDDEVFSFLAPLHPRWKLRGFREKYLLRLLAERWLPHAIAWKRKALFRAPLDSFHAENPPAFVNQLLSAESLRRADYFDPAAVAHWREGFRRLGVRSTQRLSIEMGLVGVLATQLWHHLYIDPTLADLPAPTWKLTSAVDLGPTLRSHES